MNRTDKEIQQLYDQYEKLVGATVYKRYSNPSYMIAHGLQRDSLFQYGRIGLFNACKTYNPNNKTNFETHAINNIVWSINRESKRDSLSNINTNSNEIVDRTSMDTVFIDGMGEESTLHDLLQDYERGYGEIEVDSYLLSVGDTISKHVERVIRMLMEGMSFEEIGAAVGLSSRAVRYAVSRNREKLMSLYQSS